MHQSVFFPFAFSTSFGMSSSSHSPKSLGVDYFNKLFDPLSQWLPNWGPGPTGEPQKHFKAVLKLLYKTRSLKRLKLKDPFFHIFTFSFHSEGVAVGQYSLEVIVLRFWTKTGLKAEFLLDYTGQELGKIGSKQNWNWTRHGLKLGL